MKKMFVLSLCLSCQANILLPNYFVLTIKKEFSVNNTKHSTKIKFCQKIIKNQGPGPPSQLKLYFFLNLARVSLCRVWICQTETDSVLKFGILDHILLHKFPIKHDNGGQLQQISMGRPGSCCPCKWLSHCSSLVSH